jgi:hypothetical protein
MQPSHPTPNNAILIANHSNTLPPVSFVIKEMAIYVTIDHSKLSQGQALWVQAPPLKLTSLSSWEPHGNYYPSA